MRDFSASKWVIAALIAALTSLACSLVGMFFTRAHLLDASDLVRHTSDVELAIAACRIHVREAQLDTIERPLHLGQARDDVARIGRLTADNPAQHERAGALLPRLRAFSGNAVDAAQIDLGLRELEVVEGTLKDLRLTALKRATLLGWVVTSASATLTALFVGLLLVSLYRQSRALTEAQADLRREAAMLSSIMDSMADGIMAVSPTRAFLHVNRAARRLLGDSFPGESFPSDWRSLLECVYEDGTPMQPEDGALARAIAGNSTDNLVYKTRQQGEAADAGTWISATGRPVRDADGTLVAGVVSLRDITEQKLQQDQLRAMSMSDAMTRLHNRRGFMLLAEQHARVALRQREAFAVFFADLNGLKVVNDSFGHDAGDQLIRAAADVLRATFRESDIVARLGGDEFIALLANTTPAMRDAIMTRLTAALAARDERRLSLSVGIAFFDPEHPMPLAELMVEADRLMYADKRQRRRVSR